MSDAGCINAYDCSGCLIRTLETLQSSNIGVWIQYCAPNPLDDKRLDYIKYTDKCGCTCCLSWENEILIYATDWVIKNFSLTNDDANEQVVVKWNDIFWTNWKKTVVRYSTTWFPASITDWTLAVEETTMNQYSTNWYWVTGLQDATTYYFTAFAVAQDDTIIIVQSDSITTDFLVPSTYQAVEYIQLTWIQYISSFRFPVNFRFTIQASFDTTSSYYNLYDTQSVSPMLWVDTSWRFELNIDYKSSVFTKNTFLTVVSDATWSNNIVKIDWTQVISWSKISSITKDTTLLHRWNNDWFKWKIAYMLLEEWTTKKFELIPCYRKLDSVIWFRDRINKVFKTNIWTWSFTKWPDR